MTDHDLDPTLAASLATPPIPQLADCCRSWPDRSQRPDLAASLSRFVGNPRLC